MHAWVCTYRNNCDQLCKNPPCSHILHALTKIAINFWHLHQFLIALHWMIVNYNTDIFLVLQETVPEL